MGIQEQSELLSLNPCFKIFFFRTRDEVSGTAPTQNGLGLPECNDFILSTEGKTGEEEGRGGEEREKIGN